MERKSFTFYGSFCDALSRIKSKSARCDAYDAIIRYALNGTEPDLDSMPDAAALAFIMARPVLDSSRKKAEAGRIGGSSKAEANASKAEANAKRDREGDREGFSKESKKESAPRFQPPTVEQVAEYCKERNNSVDPHRFIDYYTANGWRVGKSPMKDWKATIRNWERGGSQAADKKQASIETKGRQVYSGTPDPNTVRRAYEDLLREESA